MNEDRGIGRRAFLGLGGAVAANLAARPSPAAEERQSAEEFIGVLVDTTRCIGCRACEVACSEEHGNYVPDPVADGALDGERPTSERQWTVVNRYETKAGEVFVKRQCLHCWQPACAAACLTNAMEKTREGPVVWHPNKCMGCRYCMVSCPFNMPKFEYRGWNPRIQKCDLCFERLASGRQPACVAACPTDTLMFGKKRELIEIARVRIYNHPDRYIHHIYGEHEVGGTGWMYLSAVPFSELGLPEDLGTTPYPEFTRDFLYGVPLVLFGLPALLLGLRLMAGSEEEP